MKKERKKEREMHVLFFVVAPLPPFPLFLTDNFGCATYKSAGWLIRKLAGRLVGKETEMQL